MSKRTSNPRVRIHRTGIATLSGFNYDDLRSILTVAWLYLSDEIDRAKRKCTLGYEFAWHEEQLAFLDLARQSMDSAIRATHGPGRPPTKAARLARVREEKRFRLALDAILHDMRCRRASAEQL